MTRVCIGLFGFIRNPIDDVSFNQFKKLLPDNATIDVFVTSPNTINEYNDNNIISEYSPVFLDMKKTFNGCNVYIDVYEYEPLVFIKKVDDLGLAQYLHWPTYRVLSQHYSISRLCNNIILHSEKKNFEYDIVILTRHDMIPGVMSLGDGLNNIDKNVMYIWRKNTLPKALVAEGRFILSGMAGINALCNLYEYGYNTNDINIYEDTQPETIMGRYLSQLFNLNLLIQDGIDLPVSPSIDVKYSEYSKNFTLMLLDKYLREKDTRIRG